AFALVHYSPLRHGRHRRRERNTKKWSIVVSYGHANRTGSAPRLRRRSAIWVVGGPEAGELDVDAKLRAIHTSAIVADVPTPDTLKRISGLVIDLALNPDRGVAVGAKGRGPERAVAGNFV